MANKTISRLNISGTNYDIADITARGYHHLKNYWNGSCYYDSTTSNMNTRTWYNQATFFCGLNFNPSTGNYRSYNNGTYSSTATMTNWNSLTSGAVLLFTWAVRFQVNSAQNDIYLLTGIGATSTGSWAAAGSVMGRSMMDNHFKGNTSTNFYGGTRSIIGFSQAQWEANSSYMYNGQACVSNYTSTTINAYWHATYCNLSWSIIYRGKNTGT